MCDQWKKEKMSWEGQEKIHVEDKKKSPVTAVWGISLTAAFLLGAGFLDGFSSVCYYRAFNMQILVPVLLFLYLLMGIRSKVKYGDNFAYRGNRVLNNGRGMRTLHMTRKYKMILAAAVVLMAAAFYLVGCTAREPEERLYPMALEISLKSPESTNQQIMEAAEANAESREKSELREEESCMLEITFAWDESTGPENGEKESEQSAGDGILTAFQGSSLMDIQKQVNAFAGRYVDYSHVKAIILDENLQKAPEFEAEVIQWFAGEPAFASGLVVYPKEKSGLTLEMAAQHSSGQIGNYLEQLIKNNEKYRESSTTLGNLIAEYFA